MFLTSPTSPSFPTFIERSCPDFEDPGVSPRERKAGTERDVSLMSERRKSPRGSVRDAIRQYCAKCRGPKACARCVFGEWQLSPAAGAA